MSFVSWSSDEGIDPIPAGLKLGDVIGGCELLEFLGAGGMGAVFRARDGAGREVALKLSHRDPKLRLRLQREGELIAALHHPHIVRVHTAGDDQGWAFIACELIEGARGLDQLLTELPRDALFDHLERAGDALGHAHATGVVHRDVKAENLLVDRDDRLVVADFGLGRSDASQTLTQTGTQVGTPFAMSPEQVIGEEASPASDVWALGVLLYQVLTGGRLPFPGPGVSELCAQITAAAPRRPAAVADDVPPALDALCLRCLSRDPAQRPVDGAAFAAELRAARAGVGERSSLPVVALAVVGLITVGLGAAVAVARSGPPEVASSPSATPTPTSTPVAVTPAPTALPRGRAAWERRLASSSGDTRAARLAQAQALEHLARPAEAAGIYATLADASGADEDFYRHARALLRAGDPHRAVVILRRLKGRRAIRLRFTAELALNDLAAARTTVSAVVTEAVASPLARVLVILLRAHDPPGFPIDRLRRLRLEAPESPLVRLELARMYLRRGQLVAAREVLGDDPLPDALGAPEARDLRRRLAQVDEVVRGGPIESLDPYLWSLAATCLLREALIQIALLQRSLEAHVYADPAREARRPARSRRIAALLARAEQLGVPRTLRWSFHTANAQVSPGRSAALERHAGLALAELTRSPGRRNLGVEPRYIHRFADDPDAAVDVRAPLPSEWLIEQFARTGLGWRGRPERAQRALAAIAPWLRKHTIHHPRLAIAHLSLTAAARPRAEIVALLKKPSLGLQRAFNDARMLDMLVNLRTHLGLDASKAITRREALRGGGRARTRAAVADLRSLQPRERGRRLRQLLVDDPTVTEDWFLTPVTRSVGQVMRFRILTATADRDPRRLSWVRRAFRLKASEFPDRQWDRFGHDRHGWLLQGLAVAGRAELGRASPREIERALDALRLVLEASPASPAARITRAFLLLRRGELHRAERDLALAREHVPRAGQLLFVTALLRGARGADADTVLPLLREAWRNGYAPANRVKRTVSRYPELKAIQNDPRLESLEPR